ncbi:MAG: putative aspartyl protease [Saprospiraceae bacterium]|jgi:predicted aspartyl protease|tara:strand:+ start:486 stop:1721 length:1236 start_codon:yes stop_codon:yes gene_type:complete
MISIRTIIFCILSWAIHGSLSAQYSGLDLLGGKDKTEVKFEYINGFTIVKVIYGGILYMDFLLDTGASHNILFKKNANDLLGISYSDTIIIGGADLDGEMKALVSRNVPIMLEGTSIIQRDIIVLEKDYLDLEKMLGRRIDGIIGGDFLKGLVVDLNYKHGRLTIHNPDTFKPNRHFSTHDIDLINYKPYLKCATKIEDKTDTLNYLLDTGASLALLIHSNKIEGFKMPDNVIIGNLGKGLGGDLSGFIGMTKHLEMDQYQFNNIISSFQEIDSLILVKREVVRDGIIGNVILSRFHVIIDYVHEKLYLKPTAKLSKEFVFDKSGLLIYALGSELDQYYVKAVYPNTPAEKAGIKPGDKIIKIGFWPLMFYDLQKITKKLHGKDGKKIRMKLLRDGKEIKVEFKLKNLFKG